MLNFTDMAVSFNCTQIKNCRRFLKRCYTLNKKVDRELLETLEMFGFMEINEFSRFSSHAKDTFKIKMLDTLEITGVIDGTELFVSISKAELSLFDMVEKEIENWFNLSIVY